MTRQTSISRCLFALCVLLCLATLGSSPAQENRFEGAIQVFEARDAEAFPERGGTLFVGSSSIRMWDTERWFPKLRPLNRGFGGSQMSDCIHFAERIILPYEPRTIVLYEGDNDIAAGESAETVRDDFVTLAGNIHAALPKTRILFIAIKPSIARWALVDQMREANRLVREITDADERMEYVDIFEPMMTGYGRPRISLFLGDGLHLNDEGYALWAEVVGACLGEEE